MSKHQRVVFVIAVIDGIYETLNFCKRASGNQVLRILRSSALKP